MLYKDVMVLWNTWCFLLMRMMPFMNVSTYNHQGETNNIGLTTVAHDAFQLHLLGL